MASPRSVRKNSRASASQPVAGQALRDAVDGHAAVLQHPPELGLQPAAPAARRRPPGRRGPPPGEELSQVGGEARAPSRGRASRRRTGPACAGARSGSVHRHHRPVHRRRPGPRRSRRRPPRAPPRPAAPAPATRQVDPATGRPACWPGRPCPPSPARRPRPGPRCGRGGGARRREVEPAAGGPAAPAGSARRPAPDGLLAGWRRPARTARRRRTAPGRRWPARTRGAWRGRGEQVVGHGRLRHARPGGEGRVSEDGHPVDDPAEEQDARWSPASARSPPPSSSGRSGSGSAS